MKVKSVCIVGGGSSGWMMARALTANLEGVQVTLVSSTKIGTIGVGESTIPSIVGFISNTLKFEETFWMRRCSATYKSSIRFNNFTSNTEPSFHPFFGASYANGYNWIVHNALSAEKLPLKDYNDMHLETKMSKCNKFTKESSDGTPTGYAYHLDAGKFGELCRTESQGVNHVIGTVKTVKVSDTEGVEYLETEEGDILKADLYIDCSGFSSLLLGGALKEPFHSFDKYLINNKAMAARIPYSSKEEELQPFTDCTALSNGWAWNTPLWDRVGTGYVYSDKFCSSERAEQEFKKYLSHRFGTARAEEADIHHIGMRTGYYKRPWVKNCVSLTLTAGFIEPLESTGLAITADQIQDLLSVLKTGGFSSLDRSRYNHSSNKYFEDIKDFIVSHYINTDREDSKYWEYLSSEVLPPPKLLETLSSLGKGERPDHYFNAKSWEHILVGFNITMLDRYLRYDGDSICALSEEDSRAVIAETEKYIIDLKKHTNDEVSSMPSHYTYLKDNIYYD
jgi:tryptophan halogenase